MGTSDSEWDHRVLCSDGSCIGIIGADGRCKTCGLPYDGDGPSAAAEADRHADDLADLPLDPPMAADDPTVDDDHGDESDETDNAWENRTLCADESCIGVIGADGHCKVCGKPYPGWKP
jgi:hypothetical protein